MVVDMVLALLVVSTAGMVVAGLVQIPQEAETQEAEFGGAEARSVNVLDAVGERGQYDGILASGLFGDAGRFDPNAQPPPPPEPEPADDELEDTALNLRLLGTIALASQNQFSSAFIENLDQRGDMAVYWQGDEVVDKVQLEEVLQREVILLNERNSPPTRERLRMDDETEDGRIMMARAAPSRQMPRRVSSGDKVTLNRQEFIQDLYMNYAELVTKIEPRMYRDSDGKIVGIAADNISQVSLAKKLGLQDGDVLQTVNNEKIDSEQKIMEMVQKYRNSNAFRIGILRNGKPKIITYHLN